MKEELKASGLFRKKPVTIQAVQFTAEMAMGTIKLPDGVNFSSRSTKAGKLFQHYHYIPTLEGDMRVEIGDWIITGIKGEHYPCKPDIFAATYEPASSPPAQAEQSGWMPIETAPKDGTVILAICSHKADPYFDGERLTDYGARCEGLGHVEDGIHAIFWEPAKEEWDGWESPSYTIPAGWVHNADPEQMANPTHWMPLPPSPLKGQA